MFKQRKLLVRHTSQLKSPSRIYLTLISSFRKFTANLADPINIISFIPNLVLQSLRLGAHSDLRVHSERII